MVKEKNVAVVGAFAGDEGKGKIVDHLAADAKYVVRCEGGANAGHTIQIGDFKFVGHLLPSGAAQGKTCVLARGVRVDLPQLFQELDEFAKSGRELPEVLVDEGAFLSLPWHKALEWWVEHCKGSRATYSTMRGMAPIAATNALRLNLQVGMIFRPDQLRAWLEDFHSAFRPIFNEETLLSGIGPIKEPAVMAEELLGFRQRLEPMVADTRARLYQAWQDGQAIVFEGAQGLMLDPYWGTYGYNTSGTCTFAGLAQGCGLPPEALGRKLGVAKAIATRVGNGPFPSELGDPALRSEPKIAAAELSAWLANRRAKINAGQATDAEIGEFFRRRGNEYGATTGRPRRCGWLDAAWLRYFVEINGPDELVLTKLDCLSGLQDLSVVHSYTLDGRHLFSPPPLAADFARVKPVYAFFLPGWGEDITGETTWGRLPLSARNYIEFVEGVARCPITWIGTGPDRDHLIRRNP